MHLTAPFFPYWLSILCQLMEKQNGEAFSNDYRCENLSFGQFFFEQFDFHFDIYYFLLKKESRFLINKYNLNGRCLNKVLRLNTTESSNAKSLSAPNLKVFIKAGKASRISKGIKDSPLLLLLTVEAELTDTLLLLMSRVLRRIQNIFSAQG